MHEPFMDNVHSLDLPKLSSSTFFSSSDQGNGHMACSAGFSDWLNDSDLDIAAQQGYEAKQAVYREAGQLSAHQTGYLGLVNSE